MGETTPPSSSRKRPREMVRTRRNVTKRSDRQLSRQMILRSQSGGESRTARQDKNKDRDSMVKDDDDDDDVDVTRKAKMQRTVHQRTRKPINKSNSGNSTLLRQAHNLVASSSSSSSSSSYSSSSSSLLSLNKIVVQCNKASALIQCYEQLGFRLLAGKSEIVFGSDSDSDDDGNGSLSIEFVERAHGCQIRPTVHTGVHLVVAVPRGHVQRVRARLNRSVATELPRSAARVKSSKTPSLLVSDCEFNVIELIEA
jgi:hypothetical protein